VLGKLYAGAMTILTALILANQTRQAAVEPLSEEAAAAISSLCHAPANSRLAITEHSNMQTWMWTKHLSSARFARILF